jgi:hypothetical protein
MYLFVLFALNSLLLFGVILHNFSCAFLDLKKVSDEESFPFSLFWGDLIVDSPNASWGGRVIAGLDVFGTN